MDNSQGNNIMRLLLTIMILGIFWLILIEVKKGADLTLTSLLTWLVIIFIMPLTLMNFHDEFVWFTSGSIIFGFVYSIITLAQIIALQGHSANIILGTVIGILSMLTCLAIIVLGLRDLLKWKRKEYLL